MKYRCQTCGHKDIMEAFWSEEDMNAEIESLDDVIYVTCPACGDTFTSFCLEELYE